MGWGQSEGRGQQHFCCDADAASDLGGCERLVPCWTESGPRVFSGSSDSFRRFSYYSVGDALGRCAIGKCSFVGTNLGGHNFRSTPSSVLARLVLRLRRGIWPGLLDILADMAAL